MTALREACGYPGMRILQFAFGSGPANPYLPHNLERQCVAYTGTHDNETTVGWWASAMAGEKNAARDYLGPCGGQRTALDADQGSLSQIGGINIVVLPFQDVVGPRHASHRMNTPGQATGCWEWRFRLDARSNHEPAERLAAMTRAHGRWSS